MPDTRKRIEALGRRFEEIICDLSFAPILTRYARAGKIDILVNNAGIIRRSDFLELAEADWDEVLTVNLRSAFTLSQAVARHMVASACKGRIINIGSILSLQGGIRVAAIR